MSNTFNERLDAVRPHFAGWWHAAATTPFAADLFQKSPEAAAQHFAWQAVVAFGPIFQTLAGASPTPGLSTPPCLTALPASPASLARARGSLANAERGTGNAEKKFLAVRPFRLGAALQVKDATGSTVLVCSEDTACPWRWSERAVDGDGHFLCPTCGRLGQRMVEATAAQCGMRNAERGTLNAEEKP